MRERENNLILENMDIIKKTVTYLTYSFGIPKSEYADYLQEAYIILLDKINKYDGRTKFSTFASTVIKNAFIDIYRTRIKNKPDIISLDKIYYEDNDGNPASFINFFESSYDTENLALSNLYDIIHRVKSKQKAKTTIKGFEAFELKIQGYTEKEIALMYNVPQNHVRCWISKATKLLKNDAEIRELFYNN